MKGDFVQFVWLRRRGGKHSKSTAVSDVQISHPTTIIVTGGQVPVAAIIIISMWSGASSMQKTSPVKAINRMKSANQRYNLLLLFLICLCIGSPSYLLATNNNFKSIDFYWQSFFDIVVASTYLLECSVTAAYGFWILQNYILCSVASASNLFIYKCNFTTIISERTRVWFELAMASSYRRRWLDSSHTTVIILFTNTK